MISNSPRDPHSLCRAGEGEGAAFGTGVDIELERTGEQFGPSVIFDFLLVGTAIPAEGLCDLLANACEKAMGSRAFNLTENMRPLTLLNKHPTQETSNLGVSPVMRTIIYTLFLSFVLVSCRTPETSSAIKGNEFDAADANFAFKKNFEGDVAFFEEKPFLFVDKPGDDVALKAEIEKMVTQAVGSYEVPASFINRVRSVGDNNPYEIQVAKVRVGATVGSRTTGPWVYSCMGDMCNPSDCVNRDEEAVRFIEVKALARLEIKDKRNQTTVAIVDATDECAVQPSSVLKFTRAIRSVFTPNPLSSSGRGSCTTTASLSPEEKTLKEFSPHPVNEVTVAKAVHGSIDEALTKIVVRSPVTTPPPGAEVFFCKCPVIHGDLEYKAMNTSTGTERTIRVLESRLSTEECLEAMKRFSICN